MTRVQEKLTQRLNHWAEGHAPAGAGERALAAGLGLAALPYGLALRLRNLAYDLNGLQARQAPCPVFCVGNLSVGGTGKTPMVVALLRMIRKQYPELPCAVVSRGYRRQGETGTLVVSDGQGSLAPAALAGDEPRLLARLLPGVPVVVGARRLEAVQLAHEHFGARLVLLDDGFQHRALRRDLDLVLWDALRPASSARLLPRGLLREDLTALRRAHALLITRSNLATESLKPFIGRIKRIAPQLRLYRSELHALAPRPLDPARPAPPDLPALARGGPLAACCGLGNPRSFWRLLEIHNLHPCLRHEWPDHHRPDLAELRRLEREARAHGAQGLLMTEKDGENLPDGLDLELPIYLLPVENRFTADAAAFETFLADRLRRALGD